MSGVWGEIGVLHFLKCDFGGAGNIVIGELRNRSEKPSFLSVEESHRRRAKSASAIGYDRF